MYIHNRGDEIWIGTNIRPVELAALMLDTQNNAGIHHAEISFIETQTTLLDKESR